jgi:predicted membrane-bound dolichyl-phosphate-mannose-protein mannosyltransferase
VVYADHLRAGVFATFLFAFENMSFAQSGIAMLDVFYVTLMLAGFLFYLRGNYLRCGILMGLSMLCKISRRTGEYWRFSSIGQSAAVTRYSRRSGTWRPR